MKLSRDHLKEIVKECMLEILSEGIGPTKIKETFSRRPLATVQQERVTARSNQQSELLEKKRINDLIKFESKGDPVLASILADTASTTLPAMLMNENNKHIPAPAGSVESVVAANKPEDLFGDEAASKWAALAFMNVPKKF
jgi:hypothetical protein